MTHVSEVLRKSLGQRQKRKQLGTSSSTLGCNSVLFEDGLNGNPFDDVASDLAGTAVVETGGSWVGVTCQVLDRFEGDGLGEQVGDDGDSEGVGREVRW